MKARDIDACAERLTQTNTELRHLRREQSEVQKKLELVTRQIARHERVRANVLEKLSGS